VEGLVEVIKKSGVVVEGQVGIYLALFLFPPVKALV
jgi:hypothetical protein